MAKEQTTPLLQCKVRFEGRSITPRLSPTLHLLSAFPSDHFMAANLMRAQFIGIFYCPVYTDRRRGSCTPPPATWARPPSYTERVG